MYDVLSRPVLLVKKKNVVEDGPPSKYVKVFLKILESILEITLAIVKNNSIPMTRGELDT